MNEAFTGRVGGARDFATEGRHTELYEELRRLSKDELARRAGLPASTGYPRQALIAMVVYAEQNPSTEGFRANARSCSVRQAVNTDEGSTTMAEQTIPTAESLMEGIGEVVTPDKAPYSRLRVEGKTLAYSSVRKDGVLLDFASKDVPGLPAKFMKALEDHGTRTTMRVTAKNAKLAAELLARLAR